MRSVFILDAIRSPIGKLRGALAAKRPDDLLGDLLSALVRRVKLDPKDINEVMAGCANQAGEDNRNVARMASLLAGFPYSVPAVTVNRLCASGLEAVIQATRAIQVGDHDLVIAGGVESMSRAPWAMSKPVRPFEGGNQVLFDTSLGWRFQNPALAERFPLQAMGETAEKVAQRYPNITREQQDAFALQSHRRALAAWEAGRFADEVVPITVQERKSSREVTRDEGPRVDSTAEALARLKPAFAAGSKNGGTVTAGNASSLNDGGSVLLLGTQAWADKLGLQPLARIAGCASAGLDPTVMGLGPAIATPKALKRAGIQAADIDLAEINEAFAIQALACLQELNLSPDITNVNGGAIALGHPLGCSGARILTTLVHEMKRRPQARYGLASLCVGVGQGVSLVVER